MRSYNFLNVFTNVSIGISPIEYINHYFVLAFDLTPDSCMNDHLHISKDCRIYIKLIFNNLLKKPITVLYIATYENVITVDPDKSVSMDYAV